MLPELFNDLKLRCKCRRQIEIETYVCEISTLIFLDFSCFPYFIFLKNDSNILCEAFQAMR